MKIANRTQAQARFIDNLKLYLIGNFYWRLTTPRLNECRVQKEGKVIKIVAVFKI